MTISHVSFHVIDEVLRRPGEDNYQGDALLSGPIESVVYQRTAEYLVEWANGHHAMLDSGELVMVQWGHVGTLSKGR